MRPNIMHTRGCILLAVLISPAEFLLFRLSPGRVKHIGTAWDLICEVSVFHIFFKGSMVKLVSI